MLRFSRSGVKYQRMPITPEAEKALEFLQISARSYRHSVRSLWRAVNSASLQRWFAITGYGYWSRIPAFLLTLMLVYCSLLRVTVSVPCAESTHFNRLAKFLTCPPSPSAFSPAGA